MSKSNFIKEYKKSLRESIEKITIKRRRSLVIFFSLIFLLSLYLLIVVNGHIYLRLIALVSSSCMVFGLVVAFKYIQAPPQQVKQGHSLSDFLSVTLYLGLCGLNLLVAIGIYVRYESAWLPLLLLSQVLTWHLKNIWHRIYVVLFLLLVVLLIVKHVYVV